TGQIVRQSSLEMGHGPTESRNAAGTNLFHSEFALDPGAYQIDSTFFDPETHVGNQFSQSIKVPDFRQDLALSSIAVGHPPVGPTGPLPPLREAAIVLE